MAGLLSLFSPDRLESLRSNKGLQIAGRLVQIAFFMAVLLFLIKRLSLIGWDKVWQALPVSPVYYLLFLGWFFAIPIAELLVYRLMWGLSLSRYFAVFLRKRVYNLALLSYSGEAYMAFWAKKHLPLKGRVIFSTIKDSNILSGLASNGLTVIFLFLFLITGQLKKITNLNPDLSSYLAFAGLIGLILVPMVLHFGKHILSLPKRLIYKVFAIHFARNIAMLVLQVGMWAVVLPGVPTLTWTLFITAQLVLTRIPFLPNTDLIYLGLGLSLAGFLDAPEAQVAGMFLAAGALSQILNLVLYIGTSLPGVTQKRPMPKGDKRAQPT